MSILIKMEMPENCWKCPMANTYSGYGPLQGCFAVQGKEYACIDEPYDTHYRPSWCPLIEVPKHGLIDKQMLLRNIADNQFTNSSVGHEEDYAFWGKVWDYIFDAPTIIEAEEEVHDSF